MAYASIDDVRRKSGITDSDDYSDANITSDLQEATSFIETWTGKKYESTERTEYHEGRALTLTLNRYPISESNTRIGLTNVGQHFLQNQEEKRNIVLDFAPVISITSIEFLDDELSVDTTLESTDYQVWNDIGLIRLVNEIIPAGAYKKKIKVVYTYGTETVPNTVRELTAIIAATSALTNLSGGSFKDITSYRLGPKEVSLGEPFTNLRATITRLETKKDELFRNLGREIRMVIV